MNDRHNPHFFPGRPPLSSFRSGSPTAAEAAACPLPPVSLTLLLHPFIFLHARVACQTSILSTYLIGI